MTGKRTEQGALHDDPILIMSGFEECACPATLTLHEIRSAFDTFAVNY
jgi:hypothetical protein